MQINDSILDAQERAVFALRQLFLDSGYRRFRMNKFEPYDLYARHKDFLVSDAVLTFTGAGGRLLALRPDVTLSIVKSYQDEGNLRLQYNENVYRPDPSGGDYREIMQSGIECLGQVGLQETCQVLTLAAHALKRLDISWVLTLGHMGLLWPAIQACSQIKAEQAQLMQLVSQKNAGGLTIYAQAQDLDKGAVAELERLLLLFGDPQDVLSALAERHSGERAYQELLCVYESLHAQDLGPHIRIDFSLGADPAYYDGIVFKGYLDGLAQALLSGGRYDPLMRRLHKRSGGIGFAVYLDQLNNLKRETIS
jgi:ATP phosphoribosyltransferase regulatory subunit